MTKEPEQEGHAFLGLPLWIWITIGILIIASGFLFWFFFIRTGKLEDWWYFLRARCDRDDYDDDGTDEDSPAQEEAVGDHREEDGLNSLDISDLKPLPEETEKKQPDQFDVTMENAQKIEQAKKQTAIREARIREEAEGNLREIDEDLTRNMTAAEETDQPLEEENSEWEEAKKEGARRKKMIEQQMKNQEKKGGKKGKYRG